MARSFIALAVAAVCVAKLIVPAAAQAYYAPAMAVPDENAGAFPNAAYGLLPEPRHATSNFLRPHYGSYECATDEGHGYHWPCSRPGSRH